MKIDSKGRLTYIETDMEPQAGVSFGEGVLNDNITFRPEDLNIAVDLQVIVPKITDQMKGDDGYFDVTYSNGVPDYISFMQGSTLGEKNKTDINQLTDAFTEIPFTYSETGSGAQGSREQLGIDSIDINFNSQFFPQVKMKLTDVRAAALLSPAESDYYKDRLSIKNKEDRTKMGYSNFYSALFHFPYPRFLLSIKGFYGNKITFILAPEDVKTNFESETGNFSVEISFIGYMYGLYTDIPFTLLLAAPYIGGVSDSDAETLETNKYWKEKEEFCFANSDGSDGEHICTFIEYLDKYQKVAQEISEKGLVGTNITREYSFKKAQLKSLEELKNSFRETLTAFETANKNQIAYSYTSDENFSIYFSRKNELEIPTKVIEDFRAKLAEVQKNDNSVSDKTWVNITTKTATVQGEKVFNGDSNSSLFLNFTDGTLELNEWSSKLHEIDGCFKDEKETRKDNFRTAMSNNISKFDGNMYFFILWKNNFEKTLEDKIDAISEECDNELKDDAILDAADSISAMLGFRPTIENIFRMIFAHLDTFIHFMNSTVSSIDVNRKLRDYIKKDETNIISEGVLPPFFGYYKQGKDNKREFTYPGQVAKMRNFPEVQFVEDLCNGIMSCHNKAQEMIDRENSTAKTQGQEITENPISDEGFEGGFTPTMITDIYWDRNPYSSYSDVAKEFSTKEDECALIYYYFYTRLFNVSMLDRSIIDDAFIQDEAKNFHAANPKLRSTVLSVLKDGSKASKRLEDFMETRKNGKNFKFPYSSSDKSKYYLKDVSIPIVYENPLVNAEVTKTDEGLGNIEIFGSERVNIFNEAAQGNEKLNVSTDVTYVGRNLGRVYYDDTDGKSLLIQTFKKDDTPDASMFYNEFIKWLKENPEDRKKQCYYPILQLGKNLSNDCKNLLDDDDFWKLSEEENGLYKQGLLILASLSDSISTIFPSGNFIKRYSKVDILLIGGMLYRKGKGIFTKKGDFFKYTLSNATNLKDNEGNLNKITIDLGHIENGLIKNDNGQLKKLEQYFKKWCETDLVNLLNDFSNQKNDESRTKLHIGNKDSKETIKALPRSVQKTLLNLYIETVDLCRINIQKDKVVVGGNGRLLGTGNNSTNTNINKFAEALAKMYSDSEQTETGAANDELKSDDDSNADLSMEQKTNVYYTLSNLYTKWLVTFNEKDFAMKRPSEEIKERKARFGGNSVYQDRPTEYGNFLFLDSYQNDISQKFFVDTEELYNLLDSIIKGEVDENYSTYQFMSKIAQDNELLFLALPVYNNYYDRDSLKNMFMPQQMYGDNSKNTLGYGNTYILMYTHEVSKYLDSREDEDVRIGNDGMDMADTLGNIYPENTQYFQPPKDDGQVAISVPIFGVTYGKQNQNYFKSIAISMENAQATDYSILNQLELVKGGAHGDAIHPKGIGQNMYAIYSNRTYTCTIEMMGCMNIMPMMYFQLNNLPMFKGAYMIIHVEHHVVPGNMVTRFTGVRISKNQIPYIKSIFNLEGLLDKVGAEPSGTGKQKGGDNSFAGASRSTSTTANGLERDPSKYGTNAGDIIWDENGELIIPEAKTPIVTFDVVKAIKQMRESFNTGKTILVPSNNTKAYGVCASAVKSFIVAGGIKTWSGANGAYCYNLLSERGFGVYARGLKDKIKRLQWIHNYAQAGDIALMETDKGYGHICMYDGASWISDFKQKEIWVYSDERGPFSDIIIMRYTGTRIMPDNGLGTEWNTEFGKYVPILKQIEGGHSNVEGDLGGYTVSGVTQSVYQSEFGENSNVKDITEAQWHLIMKKNYWDLLRCDEINNQTIANLIADWGINAGVGTAAQKISGLIGVTLSAFMKDAVIKTLNEKIAEDAKALIDKIAEARRTFYRELVEENPKKSKFLKGWLARIDTVISMSGQK